MLKIARFIADVIELEEKIALWSRTEIEHSTSFWIFHYFINKYLQLIHIQIKVNNVTSKFLDV